MVASFMRLLQAAGRLRWPAPVVHLVVVAWGLQMAALQESRVPGVVNIGWRVGHDVESAMDSQDLAD